MADKEKSMQAISDRVNTFCRRKAGDTSRMQLWSGQSAALAKAEPAGEVVQKIWEEARALLALAAMT